MIKLLKDKTTPLIILFFILVSYSLFIYRIEDVPIGINGDEAAIAYSAALISNTGKDSEGRFYPIFTKIKDSNDWKQPVSVYSTVLVFKVLGVSYFNLRLVSVLFAIVSGIVIFYMTKEVFNSRFALFSFLIYLTIPIILIQSHINIENIAPLLFVAIWLWMLLRYFRFKKDWYLVVAALALGISIYSYLGLRLIMPVLTIITIFYIYIINFNNPFKKKIKAVLIFLLFLSPFILFLISLKEQYPGAILASNRPQEFNSYQQFLLPYISSFDLSFLFMKGDVTPYHSTGKEGMFLLATLPLFILGLFKIAKERKKVQILVLLVFFMIPILYGLPGSIYRASRLISLIPPFIIIALYGLQSLFEMKLKVRILVLTLVFTTIFLNYRVFLSDYWYEYPSRVNQSFEKPAHRAYKKAAEISKAYNLNVFIHDDIQMRHPTVYPFFALAYLPNNLKKWEEVPNLPEKSIVMVTEQVFKRTIEGNKNVEVIENGDMDIILVINK